MSGDVIININYKHETPVLGYTSTAGDWQLQMC